MKNKSSKIIIFIVLIILLLGSLGFVCYKTFFNNSKDASKFKEEYESLNGTKNENNGNEYMKMDIAKDNPIKYATIDEIMKKLDGTAIILFGFPECPWCRNSIPVMLDAAKASGVETIYYLNALDQRDIKSLDDNGKVVTDKEGTEAYNKLIEKLGDHASVYGGLNDETIKRLYFPTAFFVKNGTIIGSHVGTVDSQKDPYIALTSKEKDELKQIFINYMEQITTCDDNC